MGCVPRTTALGADEPGRFDRLADDVLGALDLARGGDPLRPALVVVPARPATIALREALAEAAWRERRSGLAAVDVVVAADVAASLLPSDDGRPMLSEPAGAALARCALASLPTDHPLAGLADHPGTIAELVRSTSALGQRADMALSHLETAGATGRALAEAIRALLDQLGDHWRTEDETWEAACATLDRFGLSALGEAVVVVVEGAAPEPGEARLLDRLVATGAARLGLPSANSPTERVVLLECDDPETEVHVALATLERLAGGALDGHSHGLGALGVPPVAPYAWALPRALERLGIRWRGHDRRGRLGEPGWRRVVEAVERAARLNGATGPTEPPGEDELVCAFAALRSWSQAASLLRSALGAAEAPGSPGRDAGSREGEGAEATETEELAWAEELARADAPFSLAGLQAALGAAARRPVPHDDGPGALVVVAPDQLEAVPLAGAVLLGCSEGVFPPPLADPLAIRTLARASRDALSPRGDAGARRKRIERRLGAVVAGLGTDRVVLSRPRAEWQRARRLLPANWLWSLPAGLDQRTITPRRRSIPTIRELPVVVAPSPLRPGTPLSVTGLVTYARCPRRYLVEHVLGLSPPPPAGPAALLDARRFGQAVHVALFELGRGLKALPPGALGPATAELLVARSVAAAETRLTRLGVDLGATWPAEARDCRRHVEHVLAETERRWAEEGWWVDGVELAFEARWPATEEQGSDVQAGTSSLVVQGRIDRVDAGPAGASVADYKTGAASSASSLVGPIHRALQDGRFQSTCHPDALQLACYAEALRQGTLAEDAEVDRDPPRPGRTVAEAVIWATAGASPAEPIPAAQLEPHSLHRSVALAAVGLRAGWFPPHPTTPGRSEPDANCRGCPARGGLCPDDAAERWPTVAAVGELGEAGARQLGALLDGEAEAGASPVGGGSPP
jgi:hypothetical protein